MAPISASMRAMRRSTAAASVTSKARWTRRRRASRKARRRLRSLPASRRIEDHPCAGSGQATRPVRGRCRAGAGDQCATALQVEELGDGVHGRPRCSWGSASQCRTASTWALGVLLGGQPKHGRLAGRYFERVVLARHEPRREDVVRPRGHACPRLLGRDVDVHGAQRRHRGAQSLPVAALQRRASQHRRPHFGGEQVAEASQPGIAVRILQGNTTPHLALALRQMVVVALDQRRRPVRAPAGQQASTCRCPPPPSQVPWAASQRCFGRWRGWRGQRCAWLSCCSALRARR